MAFEKLTGRLKDFAYINNSSLSANTDESLMINYLEISNVDSSGVIDMDSIDEMSFADAPSRARRIIVNGDTIISSVRPNLQAMAHFSNSKENLVCSTGFNVVSARFSNICDRFLYYKLKSDSALQYFVSTAKGVGYPAIDDKDFKSLRVAFPVKDEQQRIAKYLDSTCALIDKVIIKKQEQLDKLTELRKSIISRIVIHGFDEQVEYKSTGNSWLPKIPITWELCRLKDVSLTQTGLTLGKEYEGELVEKPYLRVSNVQDGYFSLDDVSTLNIPESSVKRHLLLYGDVLMTEGGDLDKLGRGQVWKEQIQGCLHQNHVFSIRCFNHKLKPEFLAYLTSSQHGRNYFEVTGKKTTNLASTNSTKVGLFPIPLPSIEEQTKLVEYLDCKLENLRQIQDKVFNQISVLEQYKKSLVDECVTGKRRVTEADLTMS